MDKPQADIVIQLNLNLINLKLNEFQFVGEDEKNVIEPRVGSRRIWR